MDYFTLSNGVKIPSLGIGTFLLAPRDAENATRTALESGYELVDTANAYCNEVAVGKGIKASGVPREKVFLSTKLWPTVYESDTAVDETLQRLGVDYVDLLFIHQPAGNYIAGYKQLEKAYKEGKAKSIGISNFHGEKLQKLLDAAEIKPHVIQLEAHPYCTEDDIMKELEPYGTRIMAWYPLGHGDKTLVNQPIFTKLAKKYGKSNQQIVLRWHTQFGNIVIPGSKNPDHIKANLDIFDFKLTDDEMAEIAKLNTGKKYYNPTPEQEEAYATMNADFWAD